MRSNPSFSLTLVASLFAPSAFAELPIQRSAYHDYRVVTVAESLEPAEVH